MMEQPLAPSTRVIFHPLLPRCTPLDWGDMEQWVQAEHNAFFMCDKFEKPQWVELLPAEGPDSDAFDEELNHEYCQYHAGPW